MKKNKNKISFTETILQRRVSWVSELSYLTCRIVTAFWQTNNDKIMPIFKRLLFSRPPTNGYAAIEIQNARLSASEYVTQTDVTPGGGLMASALFI